MDNQLQPWEELVVLMEKERDEFKLFNETCSRLREALHAMDWVLLESCIKAMENLSDNIRSMERTRASLSTTLCGSHSLGNTIASLEAPIKERFTRAIAELKAQISIAQSRTQSVMHYSETRGTLVRGLMEELIPSTRGRMYNQRGHSASSGGNPVIISRHT